MRTATPLRVALTLTVAPLVVSAVALLLGHGDYVAIGDLAATELITRDVGRYAVELGPYSRDGWHHPGPALYYVLAVPYRLFGSTAAALDVGALLVNGASIGAMAFVARRRGGVPLALLTLVGASLLMRTMGPDDLRLPWNPYITVLPYGLLVFLTWAMTCRERWALPAAVAVGSFIAQTHIGYLPLAVPLVALGATWLVAATGSASRRSGTAPGWRSLSVPALAAVGIAVVMWLPPLSEQVTGDPGNLDRAMTWFREGGSGDDAARGAMTGWRVVSSQYGLPPEWLFGEGPLNMVGEPTYVEQAMVPVLLLVVVAAAYGAWRRRMADAGRLFAVWLAASVVGIVATARTVGAVYEYRIGWVRVLGMVAGVLVAWVGWSALVDRRAALERRVLVPASLGVLAVLALVGSVAHVQVGRPQPEQSARLDGVIDDVVESLPAGTGPVLVDGSGAFESLFYPAAVILQLERRGIDGRMPAGDDTVGMHRMDDGEALRATLVLGTGSQIPLLEADETLELLAYDGVRPLDEVRADAAAGTDIPGGTTLAVFLRTAPAEAILET